MEAIGKHVHFIELNIKMNPEEATALFAILSTYSNKETETSKRVRQELVDELRKHNF